MADQDRIDGVVVFGGVDTHRDAHVGAMVDTAGRLLGSAQFGADPAGYAQLVAPTESRGRVARVGVEGTGSYGAGLARHLGEARVGVVEVMRPNRQLRRRRGKDDHTNAEAAARAAVGGEATAVPKSGNGPVEWIRMLTVVRRSAVKNHTQAANQIHSVLIVAPEPLKAQLREPQSQSTGPGLRQVPTQRKVLGQLRQAGSPSPSPPIPDPRYRDSGTRCRDPLSLRQGQPGAPSGPRSRPRQRGCAANRSRRQPRAHETGTILCRAVCPQPRPSVV